MKVGNILVPLAAAGVGSTTGLIATQQTERGFTKTQIGGTALTSMVAAGVSAVLVGPPGASKSAIITAAATGAAFVASASIVANAFGER